MGKYLLVFLFLIIFGFIKVNLAQEEDSTKNEETWDSDNWDNEDFDEWEWDFGKNHKDFNWPDFQFHGRPSIETSYGLPKLAIKSVNTDFIKPGAAELRLGYSTLREFEGYIIKYRNRFVFLGNFSKDLSKSTDNSAKLNAEIWRFGVGWLEGYGYQIGKSAIIPYTSNSFVWTRIKSNDYYVIDPTASYVPLNKIGLSKNDSETLDLFNDSFRFGTMTEGGIRVQLIPLISFNAGYERAIVFPRHMFWKHVGSMAIEWAGIGAIDFFVREIMDDSPAAGPIISFILKNGFSYGLYQLRREKMNWPFNTAEPLTLDTWRFGLTFTF
jgi:hypothetical protein